MVRIWYKQGLPTQLAITATCFSAFLLFGYDQGVFGGLITNENFLNTFSHPDTGFLGIIVSIYNIGCLIGAIINFFTGERFGRRRAIWAAMTLISVGAVLQCSSYSVGQLMVGRTITGIGVGIDTSTVPMYQSELCKRHVRGRLVTSEVLFTGLGVTIAYFFVYGMSFAGGALAWRLPIAMQIPPAIIIGFLVVGLPESPRWLIQKDFVDEAVSVLSHVFAADVNDSDVQGEKDAMIAAVALERSNPFKWRHIFRSDSVRTGFRLFLAALVLFMNQWAGINVIVFYAPTVLEQSVGLSHGTSLVTSGFLNLAFVVGSLVPALKLDSWGRKKPMMFGAFGMGVSMMLVSILLSLQGTSHQKPAANASVAFLITFMLCFGASLNAIPWCYSAEILPLHVRAQGTSMAVMVNWICVFIIVMTTPTMVQNIAWKTYLIFMVMNFVFVPIIYFIFPETSGLSLEEIDFLFAKSANSNGTGEDSHGAINVTEILGSINPASTASTNKALDDSPEQEKGGVPRDTKVEHVEDSP